MTSSPETVERVADVVATVLDLDERRPEFTRGTGLFGAMPELDSLAVLALIASIEDEFGVEIGADDVTAEHFQDIGSLADLVDSLR